MNRQFKYDSEVLLPKTKIYKILEFITFFKNKKAEE